MKREDKHTSMASACAYKVGISAVIAGVCVVRVGGAAFGTFPGHCYCWFLSRRREGMLDDGKMSWLEEDRLCWNVELSVGLWNSVLVMSRRYT
jgi:hypothetical protein